MSAMMDSIVHKMAPKVSGNVTTPVQCLSPGMRFVYNNRLHTVVGTHTRYDLDFMLGEDEVGKITEFEPNTRVVQLNP